MGYFVYSWLFCERWRIVQNISSFEIRLNNRVFGQIYVKSSCPSPTVSHFSCVTLTQSLGLVALGHNVLEHNGTGTQWDWGTVGLGYNGTGAQWDWDTMGLGHSGIGTQRSKTGSQP